MNRFFLIFSVLFSLTFINGCKDKDDKDPESLDLKTTSLIFNEQAGEGYVNLYSNTTWRTTWNETWLSCSPASGEGNFIVTVSAAPNTSPDVRTGIITLITEGGITKTIQVTQGGLEAFIIMTPETAAVDPLGEDLTIEVAASYPWSIQVPDEVKDWIQVKSKTESQAVFTVDVNRTGEDRSAGIIFRLNEYSEKQTTLTLSQLLLPEPEDIQFPAGGTIGENITITGNNLNLINEVWFGNAKGTITTGRTDNEMIVTIPATAEEGKFDLQIVCYDGKYVEVVGEITILAPIIPEMTLPDEGVIGRNIILTGNNLNLIEKIWLGDVEGVIGTDRTDQSITLGIPVTIAEGLIEVRIVYAGTRESNVGKITMKIVPPVVSVFPNIAYVGESVNLEGTDLDLINKVYFGSIEGSIVASGRTDVSMTINIPISAAGGEVDLKIVYLADKEKNVGKIDLKKPVNLALYAGSTIGNTPGLTWGVQNSNRMAFCAFDGIYTEADYLAFEGKYAEIFGKDLQNSTWSNSFWQGNSGSKVGEVADGGVVWVKLNYSATTGYGTADGFVTFNKITIMNRQTTPNPSTYTIEVSDDDTNWTKIISANDAQIGTLANNARVTHNFETFITAKYVRFVVVTSSNGAGNVATRQIEIYRTQ